MKTNTRKPSLKTHEGATAKRISLLQQLERSVLACFLWEKEFYESGEDIALRIHALVKELCPKHAEEVRALTVRARKEHGLRHVPLWLAVCLAANKELTTEVVTEICDRPDQMGELLALYLKQGKRPIPNSMKRGIANAFSRFSEYQLAKYNRAKASVSLRDVMFLCHPKPLGELQEEMFKKIVEGTLESPDTWEVALSAGADQKSTWERLLSEQKLGTLALLRNLRNMEQVGVSRQLIAEAVVRAKPDGIFPFQVLAAADAAPSFEPVLEEFMFRTAQALPKLGGRTAIVVDMSLSMDEKLSGKGTMSRAQAALGTAVIARELCEDVVCIGFAATAGVVKPRRGFALREQFDNSRGRQFGYGTNLRTAADLAFAQPDVHRIIIITDEQSQTRLPDPPAHIVGYLVNVASNKNGVGYGPWRHIDGFSQNILKYIDRVER